MKKWIVFLAFLICSPALAQDPQPQDTNPLPKRPGEPSQGWDFSEFGRIPLHSGGRMKPLDSYARELVLYMTERRSMKGWNSVDLMLSWMTNQEHWRAYPLIKIKSKKLKRQLLLDEEKLMFTPEELLNNTVVAQYLREHASNNANTASGSTLKFDPREADLKKLMGRLILYLNLLTGRAVPIIPEEAPAPWGTLESLKEKNRAHPISSPLITAIRSYVELDQNTFEAEAVKTRRAVESSVPGWDSSKALLIEAEYLYNTYRPFMISWILYLVGGIGFLMFTFAPKPAFRTTGWIFVVAGLLVHTLGMAARVWISGRPPVSNMYESVVWVGFGTVLFGLLLYIKVKSNTLLTVGAFVGAIVMILADAAPAVMDPSIHPLVPVLRSNYWLTIHVLTITLSYAAFALAMGLGNVVLYHFIRRKKGFRRKVEDLNQLGYRSTQVGWLLLGIGTVLGGVWADESWGRFWGWDPKEVWALIAFLAYTIVLHARIAGWLGSFGFAAGLVVSFTTVVMAWYGVNFILGVGLHSYGFSAGGSGTIYLLTVIQLAYVGFAAVVNARHKGEIPKSATA